MENDVIRAMRSRMYGLIASLDGIWPESLMTDALHLFNHGEEGCALHLLAFGGEAMEQTMTVEQRDMMIALLKEMDFEVELQEMMPYLERCVITPGR